MRTVPELTAEQRLAFVATLRSGRAIPFLHQGRTEKGADCIGFPVWALGQIGVDVPNDRIDYGKLPAKRKLAAELEAAFGPPVQEQFISLAELQPGDFVTMQWGAEEAHVAVVVDHPNGVGLIHSYKNAGGVKEHRIDENVRRTIYGVYRP